MILSRPAVVRSLFISLFFFVVFSMHGQLITQVSDRVQASHSINTLKNETLVVRLYTNYRAIDTLTKMIDKCEDINKARVYNNQLKKIKTEREIENKHIVSGFNAGYRFSEILFTYDYLQDELGNSDASKLFLDENLDFIEDITPPKEYMILGRIVNQSYDFVIETKEGDLMDKPFPNFFKVRNPFVSFYKGLTEPNNGYTEADMIKVSGKVSDKLERFLQETNQL